jgi:hypothetical protein
LEIQLILNIFHHAGVNSNSRGIMSFGRTGILDYTYTHLALPDLYLYLYQYEGVM